MLINVVFRNGNTEVRQIHPGQKLVGVRITSFVLENSDDAAAILDEHKEWFIRNVMHCFMKVD